MEFANSYAVAHAMRTFLLFVSLLIFDELDTAPCIEMLLPDPKNYKGNQKGQQEKSQTSLPF
jgi:uncharacterized membrane protein